MAQGIDDLPWWHERPALRAGWLACGNVVRRWPILGFLAALVLAACGVLGLSTSLGSALAAAAAAPILVGAVSAALFAAAAVRRHRRLTAQPYGSWLAPLPADLPVSVRAVGVPFIVWCGCALAVAAGAIGAQLPAGAFGSLLSASAAGCFLAALGAVIFFGGPKPSLQLRRRAAVPRFAPPPSRHAIVRRPRRAWASNPRLTPLGYWARAQAKFWDRPKVRARSLVLLLLALPLAVPGAVALAAATAWLILLHMLNLLLGTIRAAFAASRWLAPTSVGLVRFSLAVSHRALLAEIASCALLIGMVYAIWGATTLERALAPAIGWLGADCVLSGAACAMALRTRSVVRSAIHRWLQ